MKSFLSAPAVAAFAVFAGLSLQSNAEPPSIDQLALESGVVAWVSAWNPGDKPFVLSKLAQLYSKDVITRDAGQTLRSWAEYAAVLRPRIEPFAEMVTKPADELQVSVDAEKAETSFVIHPAGKRRDGSEVRATSRVRLVWKKNGGMWRIAEQQIACSTDSDTGAVAAR
jgi:ketosteroid isomerase-like protein